MSSSTKVGTENVSPEEVALRVSEYRRLGNQRRAPADVVYPPPNDVCPWPDCTTRIAGIKFQLDKMGDKNRCDNLLSAWWAGTGLVGTCPGCGNRVLFFLAGKLAVDGPKPAGAADLPDDWAEKAHI